MRCGAVCLAALPAQRLKKKKEKKERKKSCGAAKLGTRLDSREAARAAGSRKFLVQLALVRLSLTRGQRRVTRVRASSC